MVICRGQNREDYQNYNRLVGAIQHLALRLSKLPSTDGFRMKREAALLGKCYDMGLVNVGNKLSDVLNDITVSAFCRRRLPVVMVRIKMSQSIKQASQQASKPAKNTSTKMALSKEEKVS